MNNVKSSVGVWLGRIGERLGISRLTEVYHPHGFTKDDLTEACELAGFEIVRDYSAKLADPKEISRQYGWKTALRKRVEDEHGLWLLARKPDLP